MIPRFRAAVRYSGGFAEVAECVLVTEPEYTMGQSWFESAEELDIRNASFDESILAAESRASGSRAVISGVEKYTDPLYDALEERGGES